MIIGAGDAAVMLIKEVKGHRNLNYNIVGLIDDDTNKVNKRIQGVKVLGGRNSIVKACRNLNVSDIIVAMPADQKTKKEIYNICKTTKCNLKPYRYL